MHKFRCIVQSLKTQAHRCCCFLFATETLNSQSSPAIAKVEPVPAASRRPLSLLNLFLLVSGCFFPFCAFSATVAQNAGAVLVSVALAGQPAAQPAVLVNGANMYAPNSNYYNVGTIKNEVIPAPVAGAGASVNSNATIQAQPVAGGTPVSPAVAAAADAKAGALPSSGTINSSAQVPAATAAQVGNAALNTASTAASLASLVVPRLNAVAGVASLAANAVNLYNILYPSGYNIPVNGGTPTFNTGGFPTNQSCDSTARALWGSLLSYSFVSDGSPDATLGAVPAGACIGVWNGGSSHFTGLFNQVAVAPSAPMTAQDLVNALNAATAASNAASVASVNAALEAGLSVPLSNLSAAVSAASIASNWAQMSTTTDAQGNTTTVLNRNVINLAPSSTSLAPDIVPASQSVTIVNGSPVSSTTINNPVQQQQQQQQQQDMKTLCATSPDTLACSTDVIGDLPDDVQLVKKDVSLSITPVVFGGVAMCPAPINVGFGRVINLSSWCGFLAMLRPVLLLFAWLAAARIVLAPIKV